MDIINILNILNFVLPLIWLAAILIYWSRSGEIKVKWVKYGIFTTISLLAIAAAYNTAATYYAWKDDAVSRYLLPPHNSTYFYQYVFFHYWRPVMINLSVGAIWAGFLFAVNKYSAGRILGKNDVYLGFFTAFVVGWPKIFAYLPLVFGLLLIKIAVNNFIFKDKNPAEITGSLALSALIVAGLSNLFMKMPFWDNFRL